MNYDREERERWPEDGASAFGDENAALAQAREELTLCRAGSAVALQSRLLRSIAIDMRALRLMFEHMHGYPTVPKEEGAE